MSEIPKCWLCDKESEFVAPGDLCGEHWQKWFDYELTEAEVALLSSSKRAALENDGEGLTEEEWKEYEKMFGWDSKD
jgi:hypothetical protein